MRTSVSSSTSRSPSCASSIAAAAAPAGRSARWSMARVAAMASARPASSVSPPGVRCTSRAGDALDVGGEPGQRFEPLSGCHRSQPQGRGDVGVNGREATADPRPVHRPDLAAVAGPHADLRRLVVADDDGGRGEGRGAIRGAGVRQVRRDDLDRARQPARHPGVGVVAGHDPAADRSLGVTEPLEHQHQRRRGPAAALVAGSLAGDAIVAAHAEQPAGSAHRDRAFVPFRSQSDDDHVHSEMSEPASLPTRSQPRVELQRCTTSRGSLTSAGET